MVPPYFIILAQHMFSELKNIPAAWSKAWVSKSFRNQLITSVLVFITVAIYNFHFLRLWQDRPGILINDLLLNHLSPIDFSWPIFFIEYTTVWLVFIFVLPYPDRLVKGIQAFSFVFLARTITIYLFPLEPPRDMIFLNDPLAGFFLHRPDSVVTKDLFFSGHISALATLYLVSINKNIKRWSFIATIIVAFMILCQHVHYSMDVFFAPIVSYICYKMVTYIHSQTKYGLELQDA